MITYFKCHRAAQLFSLLLSFLLVMYPACMDAFAVGESGSGAQAITGSIAESTIWPNGATVSGDVTISGGTQENPIVISVPGTVYVNGGASEGCIFILEGAHVRFQGTGAASKIVLREDRSYQPFIYHYFPNETAGASVQFDRLTLECNDQPGMLWLIGNRANPMQVDFSETVVKNANHNSVLLSLGACRTHFRSGTKFINNRCGTLIQQGSSDPEQFNNTMYLHDGCEFSGNTCTTRLFDLGVYSKFVMYGGAIRGNTVTANDALIPIFDGAAEIYGGSIENNTSSAYILENYCGTLNVYGGVFSGNTASNGGVLLNISYVSETESRPATANIYGGSFIGNTGNSGGGAIWNNKNSILNLFGGTFSENTAGANGGAVYSSGILNIAPAAMPYTENGIQKTSAGLLTVVGNTAANTGGGIAMGTTGALTLGGSNIRISGNTSTNDKGADLALLAGRPAAVTSALENSDIRYALLNAVGAAGAYTQGVAATVSEEFELTETALQLVQPGFVAARCGEEISVTPVLSAITVAAHSLTLNGDIGVNFYVDIPGVTDAAYAEFTVDGQTVQVPVDLENYQVLDGKALYKISCNVVAAQLDTAIIGVIYNGDMVSDLFSYSVHAYLTEAQQTMNDNAAFMALASSLATYGYYANILNDYNPDFTQHPLFNDAPMAAVTADALASAAAQIESTEAGVVYYGSSLVLRSKTAIHHYFSLPADKTVEDFTFTCDGKTLTPKPNGSYYYVEIPDIASAKLGTAYVVTVTDANGNAVNTWAYSAMSYAYKALMLENADQALTDAAKALAVYYGAAQQYFGA